MIRILQGDCRETLKTLDAGSVHCCVTSPPYWGLRDYGVDGQIGLESSPEAFVAEMVGVFREVRRVLREDGTAWVNLGDSYSNSPAGGHGYKDGRANRQQRRGPGLVDGLKQKDLVGIPWMVAFALRADGWFLRSEIIWHKPNPMPESVSDRPTKAHETIFLLSKSQRYYYDAEAIKEPVAGTANPRVSKAQAEKILAARALGKGAVESNADLAGVNPKAKCEHFQVAATSSLNAAVCLPVDNRNKRTVWTVPSRPYREAHFATYPPDLIKPCILAGCPAGGVVLDPFGGSGTTGEVAHELGRHAILCELNGDYVKLMEKRTNVTGGLGL